MLTEKRRRGPPKSGKVPLSAKERAKRHREKIKQAGTTEVRTCFDADELKVLIDVRERWGLPQESTHADVIRAMAVVLAGHTLVTTGKRIKAEISISFPQPDKAKPKSAEPSPLQENQGE
ncbi:TPA: hypothetical protein QIR73_004802 [Enterobacter cloacae]|nr:hypothetical protein [Enterobacter cloacae]